MKMVGVDVGGTFTDLVWYDRDSGDLGRAKTLTTPDPALGLVAAFERTAIKPDEVELFLHATTLITNLILQRTGGRVGFVTTKGFPDLLDIQTSMRPNPYDLQWEKTPALVPRYLRRGITERIDASGNVLVPPNDDEIRKAIQELVDQGIDVLAVCLLNSYANPVHEQHVAQVVRESWPTLDLSLSYEIDPRIREYPRMSTTVANAYAMPVFSRYAVGLDTTIPVRHGIKFMQSSGGVVGSAQAAQAPVNLVYSGPVGGVLASQLLGQAIGVNNLITADVGGTSFDVCVIRAGEADEKDEAYVQWGIPIRAHTVDIHSIGAGGGSIVEVDAGGVLKVGPQSAGSHPGPASYGRGGEHATLTDANLLLGLIRAERFAGGEIPLKRELAEQAMTPIAKHFGISVQEAAVGAFRTVNSNMAQAIRELTVFKGVDPREFTLLAFGGGGPQHAVEVARELEMKSVIVPVFPSVFSAFGLLSADLLNTASRTILTEISTLDVTLLERDLQELEGLAKEPLRDEEVIEEIVVRRIGYMRYIGQSHELTVPLTSDLRPETLYSAFEEAHQLRYGTRLGDPAEIVDVKVVAVGRIPKLRLRELANGSKTPQSRAVVSSAFGDIPVYDRDDLSVGITLEGPALIEEPDTTMYLPSGTSMEVDGYGNLRIQLT
jgi:N-methylhydantoinase A